MFVFALRGFDQHPHPSYSDLPLTAVSLYLLLPSSSRPISIISHHSFLFFYLIHPSNASLSLFCLCFFSLSLSLSLQSIPVASPHRQ